MAWGLTRGMARVLGLDLVEAVTQGWYARHELASLIDTCTACSQSERCKAYLAVTGRAESLPGFCHNKTEIEALRP